MSISADQFVAKAATKVGYHVTPGKQTIFGQWYGIPAGAWCAMFLSWVAHQLDAFDILPKFAWTPAGAEWFKARGQWHNGISGIRRGDIVFYNFPDNVNRIQHVGVVEHVHGDGSFTAIEGNTSGTGSQSNGGWLLRKRRKSYVVGYGRPAWGDGGSTPVIEQPANSDNVLEKGDSSDDVRGMQGALLAIGYTLGPFGADGEFGEYTRAALIAFQKSRNIEADGIYGPVTRGKLREAIGLNADGTARTETKPDVTSLQRAVRTAIDNIWGNNTDTHFDALREASEWGGRDFPFGVQFAQQVVGAAPDGVWGPKSNQAHDTTTRAVQSALWRLGYDPGVIDGIWGDKSEAAYQDVRGDAHI